MMLGERYFRALDLNTHMSTIKDVHNNPLLDNDDRKRFDEEYDVQSYMKINGYKDLYLHNLSKQSQSKVQVVSTISTPKVKHVETYVEKMAREQVKKGQSQQKDNQKATKKVHHKRKTKSNDGPEM